MQTYKATLVLSIHCFGCFSIGTGNELCWYFRFIVLAVHGIQVTKGGLLIFYILINDPNSPVLS